MQPRGKTKQLIEAMQAQPEKVLWLPADCAAILGKSVSSSLAPAVRRGWLYKHELNGRGRRVAYSLQPQEVAGEEPAPAEFNAALWADGELVLHGVELNPDGRTLTLKADQVRLLCRLLHGQGPEA